MDKKEDFTEIIKAAIEQYVAESANNSLGGNLSEKAWEVPLVGFSRGDDPLYYKCKQDIGEFYWTPYDIFKLTYPDIKVNPHDLSVISWILPQTKLTKEEQRKECLFPTRRATLARLNGEVFNNQIAKYVSKLINEKGYAAEAPGLSPYWENRRSEKYGFASTWSERHVAHICGLGTFGLSDALITP